MGSFGGEITGVQGAVFPSEAFHIDGLLECCITAVFLLLLCSSTLASARDPAVSELVDKLDGIRRDNGVAAFGLVLVDEGSYMEKAYTDILEAVWPNSRRMYCWAHKLRLVGRCVRLGSLPRTLRSSLSLPPSSTASYG